MEKPEKCSLSDGAEDEIEDCEEEPMFISMSLEEEVHLKKVILKGVLQKELACFASDPKMETLEANTLLLHFLYNKFLLEFPPFKKKQTTTVAKLNELLVRYPSFIVVSKNATKRNYTGYKNIANMYDAIIKTEKEREHQNQSSLLANSTERREMDQIHIMLTSSDNIQIDTTSPLYWTAGKEAFEGMFNIVEELKKSSLGIGLLNDTIKNAKTLKELPSDYRKIFGFIHKRFPPIIHEEFSDPKKLSKTRTLLTITPQKAIRGLLKITNPMYVISGILNLFLARPFGAKSIMQRIFTEVSELTKTERQIKELKKRINDKKIIMKIDCWVEAHYSPDMSNIEDSNDNLEYKIYGMDEPLTFVRNLLLDKDTMPKFTEKEVDYLIECDCVNSVKNLTALEMRLRDKVKFIDIFGDDQVVALMKEFLPALYEPLFEVYWHADMSTLVGKFFDLMHDLLDIAEAYQRNIKNLTNSKRDRERELEYRKHAMKHYEYSLERFEEALYQAVRNVIKSESACKTLEEVLGWAFNFFTFGSDTTVDLNAMLKSLRPDDQERVRKELKAFAEYKRQHYAQKQLSTGKRFAKKHPPPETPAINELLQEPFLGYLREILLRNEK